MEPAVYNSTYHLTIEKKEMTARMMRPCLLMMPEFLEWKNWSCASWSAPNSEWSLAICLFLFLLSILPWTWKWVHEHEVDEQIYQNCQAATCSTEYDNHWVLLLVKEDWIRLKKTISWSSCSRKCNLWKPQLSLFCAKEITLAQKQWHLELQEQCKAS